MIKVLIPGQLQQYCDGAAELQLSVANVVGVLMELEERHPNLYRCVCDEIGRVRKHVNLFVNSLLCRARDSMEQPLVAGDVVFILPAVSGG